MTACVNRKHTKKVAAVVTASLVGALSLGVAPVAAMADTGIDLQFEDPNEAFDDAEVVEAHFAQGAGTDVDKKVDGVYHIGYSKNEPVSLNWVSFKIYGETTNDLLVIDPVKDPETYEVSYCKRGENGEVGDEVTDPTDAGKYYAVVTAIDGTYKGASFAVPFQIDAVDISDIKLAGEISSTYDAETKDIVFYLDNNTNGSVDDGEQLYVGTDIDVQWYEAGHDLSDQWKVDSVLDAGDYRAYVTGKGNYTGAVDLNSQTVKVKKLDLAGANVFIPGIYVKGSTEPTDPQWIMIDGQLFGSDSAIMGEIKAEMDKNAGPDNIWNKNGKYTYIVSAAQANDPNFTSGTKIVNAYKLADELAFTYKGEAVESGYDIFTGDADASFDDNKIVGVDDDKNEYSRANGKLNVLVYDANGNVVYDTLNGNTSRTWWTEVGSDFTAFYWYENADGTVGGQLVLPVHVYQEAVDADASAAVLYDVDGDSVKEVVSSIEAVYSGKALDIDVRIKDANGNVVTNGFNVAYYDADGNQVGEIVNAGTYTLKVTSSTYKLTGTTEMTITVSPLDVSGIKVGALKTQEWDNVGNKTEYLRWTKNFAYRVQDLDLQYKSGDNYILLPTKDVKVTILDASGAEIDKIEDEGAYTLHFEARNADAENNYVLPADITVTCIKDGKNADGVNHLLFADVEYTDYFANAVSFVANEQFMTGYKGTKLFGSFDQLNRGQMAIVLYNMAKGEGKVDENGLTYTNAGGWMTGFDDVNGNEYYAKAIAWAKLSGVVNGYDDGTFGPEDPVTREQFAAMLMNYTKKFGDFEAADTSALDEYDDANTVSDWAENSVAWGIENGILGNGGFLNAQGEIIRADAACMVYNYAK